MARRYDLQLRIGGDDREAQRALRSVNAGLDRTARRSGAAQAAVAGLTRAFGALAAAASIGGLARSLQQIVAEGDRLQKLSVRLGETTDNLSQLAYVAERSGVSTRTMETALQRLQRRVAEAAQGTGEARDAIAELGLRAERLNMLGPAAQLEVVADAMQEVEVAGDRTRLAMRLFDTEGVAMLQTMTDGAAGIRDLKAEFDALGGTLTQDTADAMARTQDELAELDARGTALGRAIAREIVPPLNDLLAALNDIADSGAGAAVGQIFSQIASEMESLAAVLRLDWRTLWNNSVPGQLWDLIAPRSGSSGPRMSRNQLLDQWQALAEYGISGLNPMLDATADSFWIMADAAGAAATATDDNAASIRASADDLKARERVINDTRTAEEQYIAELEKLTELRNRLASTDDPLSDADYLRAVQQLREEYLELDGAARTAAGGTKTLTDAQRDSNPEMDRALSTVQSLIREYLPAEAAARDLADAQAALALAGEAAELSHDQQAEILRQLREDMAGVGDETQRMTDVFGREIQSMEDIVGDGARRMADDFEDTLADGFERLFTGSLDSAQDFMDAFGRVLISNLARIAAQIASQTIFVNIAGNVAGGGAQGGLTGNPETSVFGGGGFGGLGNLGQLFGGNSMGQSAANIGMGIGSIFGGGAAATQAAYQQSFGAASLMGDSFGGSMVQGSLAANAATPAWASNLAATPNWAMMAGGFAGSMLSNAVFDFDSEAAQIGNTIGSAAGAAIGQALIPIPGVGAAIGAFLGGSAGGGIGGLFGGETDEFPIAYMGVQGGDLIFPKAERTQEIQQELNEFVHSMNALIDQFDLEIQDRAVAKLRDAPAIEGFMNSFAAEVETAIRTKLSDEARAGAESAGSVYARIVEDMLAAAQGDIDALMQIPEAAQRFYDVLQDLAPAMGLAEQAVYDLANSAGSIDALAQAHAGYVQAIYSETEQLALRTQELQRTFNEIGATSVSVGETTIAEYRAIVEAQDLSTEAGRQMRIALMQLAPAFAEMTRAAEDQARAAEEAVSDIADAAVASFEREADAAMASITAAAQAAAEALREEADALSDQAADARSAASEWGGLAQGIEDWIARQRQTLATDGNARDAYRVQLAAAMAGDQDAIAGLTGYADEFLQAALRDAGTQLEYDRTVARTIGEVADAGELAADREAALLDTAASLDAQAQTLIERADAQLALAEERNQRIEAQLDQARDAAQAEAERAYALHGQTLLADAANAQSIIAAIFSLPAALQPPPPQADATADLAGAMAQLQGEIAQLRSDQRVQHAASYREQRDQADLMRRWEAIGQPEARA